MKTLADEKGTRVAIKNVYDPLTHDRPMNSDELQSAATTDFISVVAALPDYYSDVKQLKEDARKVWRVMREQKIEITPENVRSTLDLIQNRESDK